MPKIKEEELDIEIPDESDENVGDGAPKKKKRKKSKEERIAERRVVFWTLLIIMLITLGFWLVPIIGSMFRGEPVEIKMDNSNTKEEKIPAKSTGKNYVEITL